MPDKARHAFGSEANIDAALQSGLINEFDILFLDEGKIGWIDKDGKKVILEDKKQVLPVSELPAIGDPEVIYVYGNSFYFWNGESYISPVADGIDESLVDQKIAAAKHEAKHSYEEVKFEIDGKPAGTLIDYFDKEIRIMCPVDTVWTKQNVGEGGDKDCHYVTLKIYAPENATGYVEHLGGQVDDKILTDLSTDEFGRKYQPTWLAVAKYDEATDTWSYYGKSSTVNKYIGWDYQIDWYDDNGVMIASDCTRINLSNESCHSSIEPYYVNAIDAKIEEIEAKVSEVAAIEIIEF